MVGDHVLQPILGCLGFPVAGNSTQFVTERALKAVGLDWSVITTSVPPNLLQQAILGAKAMRFAALAILDPHQLAVAQMFDQLTPAAMLSGQVQVAKRVDEIWIGHDIRGEAVEQALADKGIDPTCNVLVFGTSPLVQMLARVDSNRCERFHSLESLQTSNVGSRITEEPSGLIDDLGRLKGTEETRESLPLSVLLVSVPKDESLERQLSKIELSKQGLLIAMGDMQLHDGWKEWSTKRGWDYVSPLDFQAQVSAKMFSYWTQVDPPIHSIREWIDEYHEW